MTIDLLEALRALVAEATPGPWTLDHHGVDDYLADVWTEPGEDEERICENATAEDARLIVLAPTLAAEVIDLREREARLVKVLAVATYACRVVDEAVKEGHQSLPALVNHFLQAVEPARAALAEIEKEAGDAP